MRGMISKERIAVVYNEPYSSRYDTVGEEMAVLGVLESVEAVYHALLELGYKVSLIPLVPPAETAEQLVKSLEVDLVFNLFEGF